MDVYGPDTLLLSLMRESMSFGLRLSVLIWASLGHPREAGAPLYVVRRMLEWGRRGATWARSQPAPPPGIRGRVPLDLRWRLASTEPDSLCGC